MKFFVVLRPDGGAAVIPDLETLLGRLPLRFAQLAEDHAAAFELIV